MRGLLLPATLALLVPLGTLSRPIDPAKCGLLDLPTPTEMQEYREAGPYRAGFTALMDGRETEARKALEKAWKQVQEVLAPFTQGACRDQALRDALRGTVFASPPTAVPGEDRFLPPPAVVRTVAVLRCRAGDLEGAARWLLEHGALEDPTLRSAAAIWLGEAGHPQARQALEAEERR